MRGLSKPPRCRYLNGTYCLDVYTLLLVSPSPAIVLALSASIPFTSARIKAREGYEKARRARPSAEYHFFFRSPRHATCIYKLGGASLFLNSRRLAKYVGIKKTEIRSSIMIF